MHPIKATNFDRRSAVRRAAPTAPPWPSYTGVSQFVGTSPSGRVTVYVDPSLGAPGLQNAQDLVSDADRVVSANDTIFATTGGSVSVIVYALAASPTEPVGPITVVAITSAGQPSRWTRRSAAPAEYRRSLRPN